MAAQEGRDLLLKIGDGASPETFTTVGGGRSDSLRLNEQPVDITNKSTADRFVEMIKRGRKSVTIQHSGVFLDGAAEETLRADYFDSVVTNYQIVVPDFGTFEGPFIITDLEYGGDDGDAVAYSATLQSAGSISFTAA